MLPCSPNDQAVNTMPKAKPVSLHPLTFHEALKHLVKVDPDRVGLTSKRRKKRRKRNLTARES
jgi:hypothetical protein